VEVRFRTNKLKENYEKSESATKAWGKEVARKYIQRIDLILSAQSLQELNRLPGLNYHPLKGKRKGQHAVSLKDSWRLIFTLHGDQLEIVQIEEVSKHYGD